MNANTNNTSGTKQNTQMFASFERNIFIPLNGDDQDATKVYNTLKDNGARVALHRIENLIKGTEDTVRDFEVVTVQGRHIKPAAETKRTRTRDYEPSEPVKPIKRGTTYAMLMEMMLVGATMDELLAKTNNETQGGVNDVISWQVRQRGYGIRFDKPTGKFHLLMPKGQKELIYSN